MVAQNCHLVNKMVNIFQLPFQMISIFDQLQLIYRVIPDIHIIAIHMPWIAITTFLWPLPFWHLW